MRPYWTPSWISQLAISSANLCRQFQKLQTLPNILVHNTTYSKVLRGGRGGGKWRVIPSEYSDLARNRTCPRFYRCPRYLQVWRSPDWKCSYRSGDIFPHYKSMGAFACHGNQTFHPICPPNLMQPFPHPSDASEIFKFKSVDDGRTPDYCYTISSPCEPAAQVSWKVNGSFRMPWKPDFSSDLPPNLMQPFPHPSDASEIFKFKSVDDGRTPDYCYTISSPCEPAAQVSWKVHLAPLKLEMYSSNW